DLAKSLRELAGLAFYSNPGTDPRVTGYDAIWKRSYPSRPDVDVVRLRQTGQPDLFDPGEVASIFQEHHPYDRGRLFANDGRPKVAVIGSGAGGAVVAARLAASGRYDVAIFESGPRMTPAEYPLDTLVGMARLFEGGLMTLSRNLDIHLLRGRVVGGGTVMTSGLSVEMRSETKSRWCSTSGELAIGVTQAELDAGFAKVHAMQHMGPLDNLPDSLKTSVSELLKDGADALTAAGEPSYVFNADNPQNNVMMHAGQGPAGRPDQNGDYCFGCGLCNYGCHFGHKLSMDLSYLPFAESHGAKIHPNLPIERLVGDVVGGRLEVTHLQLGRGLGRVAVDHVVLAAGAVGTPALLLRSVKADGSWRALRVFDEDDGHVGKGLGFNYGSGVVARWKPTDAAKLLARAQLRQNPTGGPFPDSFPTPGHLGFQIRYVATKAGDPDFRIAIDPTKDPLGRREHFARYVLENAFVPPSLLSNVVPGVGKAHLDWMRDYRNQPRDVRDHHRLAADRPRARRSHRGLQAQRRRDEAQPRRARVDRAALLRGGGGRGGARGGAGRSEGRRGAARRRSAAVAQSVRTPHRDADREQAGAGVELAGAHHVELRASAGWLPNERRPGSRRGGPGFPFVWGGQRLRERWESLSLDHRREPAVVDRGPRGGRERSDSIHHRALIEGRVAAVDAVTAERARAWRSTRRGALA
ncbi:MAG: GMC family oxidoreductase N-terminal domain-containing protein, partial [Myxococcota bacterium]|nr:GMC family oxidoreductase N-terminal domain-containing protein [Myxococcota bacterium]